MYAEHPDVDREHLRAVIQETWGLSVASLRYEPVGFGTHHYLVTDQDATRWFVNVDELAVKSWLAPDAAGALDALDRALRTTLELRRLGLEFVHAPLEPVLATVGDGFAASVYPFVDGRSNDFGEYTSDDERRTVLRALGRMHAATDRLPGDLARRDNLDVPLREAFLDALESTGTDWTGGPFSEPARRLLATKTGSLRAMFDRYDELAGRVRTNDQPWVVTHGEPHAANTMWTDDDALVLIDWDTVAIAPRERDLWMIEPRNDDEWSAHASGGGVPVLDPTAVELYRSWWALSEITGYTISLRGSHEDDANTRLAWKGLQEYVLMTSEA